MPDYTPSEIVDILLVLGECTHHFNNASRLYRVCYPDRQQHPNPTTIRRLERRVRQGHLRRERSRRDYNEEDVRVLAILAAIHINPHTSSRQMEREIGIPRRTVLRILKKLKYHAYHITLTQALNLRDMRVRVHFCQWAQEMIRADPSFFLYVMFSDEATFKNNGQLNRHNCHYWSNVNPNWTRQVDNQHRWSLNVWCGIINGYLIGPYFFNGNVNGENFLNFLANELPVFLEDVDLDTRRRMWIQLDGAAPHYARIVKAYLNERYANRWIGRGGPINWPPRSPDLTSPDFFLWGYLKNVVYEEPPTTRENMKQRIEDACRHIPREVLLKTVRNFQNRLALCIQENGNNFEQFLR